MTDHFYNLARKLRPNLESLTGQRRLSGVADVITLLYTLPLAVLGLGWLILASDWNILRLNWPAFILMGVLMYLFTRLSFFVISEIRSGGYANTEGALDGMVLWTAVFLFGPTALWLDVLANIINLLNNLRQPRSVSGYWVRMRLFSTSLASNLLSYLVALFVYRMLGGGIPITSFSLLSLGQAMVAIFAQFCIEILIYTGYISYIIWGLKNILHSETGAALRFFILAFALPALANPFAILAVVLYQQEGLVVFLFDMVGLLLVAVLARRLSQAAESGRQQSRQLQELEKLGRAIINSPPDASTLTDILAEHVPSMFAARGIGIWTEGQGSLFIYPSDWSLEIPQVWKWLQSQQEVRAFLANEPLPWQPGAVEHGPLLVAPILQIEQDHPIGGVYIELQPLTMLWDERTLVALLPPVQSLSAQVASALHQAHVYEETLSLEKTRQEISLARQIQASFLPDTLPHIPGWQLAATLEPARQMAGDFYDFIALPNGQVGILIADVADKGLGPALYMALSSTLLRTFATQFTTEPAAVMAAVNQRILRDARANLFVTVFYGVLDPDTGLLTYANAGHSPPYLFRESHNGDPHTLRNTGIPLGIDEESTWRQEVTQLLPGDVLLLYTDGVTDAQNMQGEFIDRKSVLQAAYQHRDQHIDLIKKGILDEVHHFVGDAPRFDDITLVILKREC